jgi:hypothetical protein
MKGGKYRTFDALQNSLCASQLPLDVHLGRESLDEQQRNGEVAHLLVGVAKWARCVQCAYACG